MEIKEAIEQLKSLRTYGECYNGTVKVGEIIDLIEGQQAEIERIKNELKTNHRNSWKNKFFKVIEENAELQKQVDELKKHLNRAVVLLKENSDLWFKYKFGVEVENDK